jgi:hypothetical protein
MDQSLQSVRDGQFGIFARRRFRRIERSRPGTCMEVDCGFDLPQGISRTSRDRIA